VDVSSGPPSCRVRLFGGLRVEVDGRSLEDKSWRKRKARLLFAMMTSRCGKDIPRDQLIEYLWPEMDEQRALNNFYVAWSCMKHALSPHLKRGDVCAFVEHRGGVCRTAAGRVGTDVDEFDTLLSAATKARSEGNEIAELMSLQSAADLYRGELLPGEAYDDWFSALRERCRHDFEDAMLRAANLLEARGDLGGGLSLLRRALQHDPWREDLYQAALRLQMAAGQRSAAIETYLACRTRLAEDLGIDPSGETMRLYEQVLGMEERKGAVDYGAGGRLRAAGAAAEA
jgi:DNA-binding SARP family transcriptional activator